MKNPNNYVIIEAIFRDYKILQITLIIKNRMKL